MYPQLPPIDEGTRVAGLLIVAAFGLLLGAAAMRLVDLFDALSQVSP